MNSDVSLEQYVLACMIAYKECALEVELLQEKDFTSQINRTIYQGIKDLVRKNKNFDTMILLQHLQNKITPMDLAFIGKRSPMRINFKEYIRRLKDLTLKRQLHNMAEKILCSDSTGEELSERIEKQIFELRENTITEEFMEVKDMVLDAIDDIERTQKQKGHTGVETGFKKLDEITDGFQKSDYILLGARPSMGKTALALNITLNIAKNDKKVAFFSLEMSRKQVVKRLVLSESLVSDKKIKNKELKDDDYRLLVNAGEELYKKNIFVNDNAALTVPQMKSMCRKLKRSRGLDIVLIDYLQLIRSREGSSRREQVEAVSRDLKAMAKELDVPVVVISSLSRANEARQNKRPILSDLRETGQIEFDADLIMFLHRENYYDPESNPYLAELIIAKQRNGGLGVIQLGWIGECTTFMDYDKLELNREED